MQLQFLIISYVHHYSINEMTVAVALFSLSISHFSILASVSAALPLSH